MKDFPLELVQTFKEGDVIGDPLFNLNIYSKSKLVAEPGSQII